MTLTHWLPPFTTRGKFGRLAAACGEYIELKQHTTEPMCAECAAYLAKDLALDADLEATFAADDAPNRFPRM